MMNFSRVTNHHHLIMGMAFLVLFVTPGVLFANQTNAVESSTVPIGSSYYRILAHDFGVDIHELVKFERKGFGRSEIVALVLISLHTEQPIKDYGNRRIKDKVPLKKLSEEAGFNHRELMKVVRQIKSDIEEQGDSDLPPPAYPKPKEKEKKSKKSTPLEENKDENLDIQTP